MCVCVCVRACVHVCVRECPYYHYHHVLCIVRTAQDAGAELMPTDIKYYQEFGGEKVIFEKEEVTEMKKFAEPGAVYMHSCH